ncbi:MAG: class I SAM-dependent methyltransferase [Candidatus Methanomethyliaceae archaeon]
MRYILCPLCGSNEHQVVSRFSGPWNFRMPVVICKSCGFLFRNPQWDEDEAKKHYKKISRYYTLFHGNPRLSETRSNDEYKRAIPRLEWVQKYIKFPAKILDVGAGSGAFVELANQSGAQAIGIELDKDAVQIAQRKGIPMELTSLEDSFFHPNSFDVITMFHVLEHVTNLHTFIMKAQNLLRPGGFLFIEVPDTSTLRERPKYYFVPEHNWNFTSQSLTRLFSQQGGWEIIEVNNELGPYSHAYNVLLFVVKKDLSQEAQVINSNSDDYKRMVCFLQELEEKTTSALPLGVKVREKLSLLLGPWLGLFGFKFIYKIYYISLLLHNSIKNMKNSRK